MSLKIITIFASIAFYASLCIAQDQTQQQDQPQVGLQGWYQQNSGVTGTLGHVQFINKATGWAGALYTTDGGNNWSLYQNRREVIQFVDSLNGWSVSPKGSGWISHTMDGGNTWLDYHANMPIGNPIFFCSPNRGFFAINPNSQFDDQIAMTSDSGKTWILDTTKVGRIAGFACWDSLNIIAAGSEFTNPRPPYDYPIASVFISNNAGKSWSFGTHAHVVNGGLKPFLAFSPTTVWFTGGLLGVVKSYNRGSSIIVDSNILGEAMAASDSNNITVVGAAGSIYRTFDAGKNWVKQNSGTIYNLFAASFVDSTTGWAVGDAGTILHTTNAGTAWVRQYPPSPLEVKVTPEPFAINTTLSYSIPKAAMVEVKVYDVMGKEVHHVESEGIQSEGRHQVELKVDGLPSGVYYFLLNAGGFTGMGKLTKIAP